MDSNHCQHPGCTNPEGMEIEFQTGDDEQIVYYCEDHCWEHGICRACGYQIDCISRQCGCTVDDETLAERDQWECEQYEERTGHPFGPVGCLFPGNCVMPGEHFTSECCLTEQAEETYQQMDDFE